MINQNCKYSYYNTKFEQVIFKTRSMGITTFEAVDYGTIITTDETLHLLNSVRIASIVGHSNCLMINSHKFSGPRGKYICEYTPDLIEKLYGVNAGLTDIIHAYLGRKCENAEQARIYFMAKVLGEHETLI